MEREDALKKIKKCLALAGSAEPHEAAGAMRQARKLMEQYRVTDHELSFIDVHEVPAKATSTANNAWESWLTHVVAEAFGCEVFDQVSEELTPAFAIKRVRRHIFVGLESAPTIAAYAMEVLSRQCAKARLQHIARQPKNCKPITKSARGDAFAKGWVSGVSDLIDRFAQPEKAAALLLQYIESKYPDMKSVKPVDRTKRMKGEHGHASAGFKAGAEADLRHGLGAEAPRPALGQS